MKIKALILSLAIATGALAGNPGKNGEYKVDKEHSKLTWVGKKVTGQHTGNINFAEGKFTSDGKTITGGTFEIDMNSITNTDLTDDGYNQKLIGHLKSDDFFGTTKFPKSTLIITNIKETGKNQYQVKGKLTIKGITKDVEFPAAIATSGNQLKGTATIKIDRTQYDIKYGSGNFFENLGDKAIDNEFELNVDLVASK